MTYQIYSVQLVNVDPEMQPRTRPPQILRHVLRIPRLGSIKHEGASVDAGAACHVAKVSVRGAIKSFGKDARKALLLILKMSGTRGEEKS